MNISQSYISKDSRGNWRGELDITSEKLDGKTLRVIASKNYSGLTTCSATAGVVQNHDGYSSFEFVLYQDFHMNLGAEARCTSKNVEKLLDNAKERAAEIVEATVKFYADKAKTN